MKGSRLNHLLLAAVWLAGGSPSVLACATCFGNSDSSLAKGMNSGILFLLGVVGMVLGGLVTVIALFAFRSRNLARAQAALQAPVRLMEPLPTNALGSGSGSGRLSVAGVRANKPPPRPSCRAVASRP